MVPPTSGQYGRLATRPEGRTSTATSAVEEEALRPQLFGKPGRRLQPRGGSALQTPRRARLERPPAQGRGAGRVGEVPSPGAAPGVDPGHRRGCRSLMRSCRLGLGGVDIDAGEAATRADGHPESNCRVRGDEPGLGHGAHKRRLLALGRGGLRARVQQLRLRARRGRAGWPFAGLRRRPAAGGPPRGVAGRAAERPGAGAGAAGAGGRSGGRACGSGAEWLRLAKRRRRLKERPRGRVGGGPISGPGVAARR
mmetsp:Transcript_86842/g.244884  ORF Transcript_86842/g.244884 Transcript_86842/m.244884 type:complete len:253 (-) Transcript_86842:255-1013(-)